MIFDTLPEKREIFYTMIFIKMTNDIFSPWEGYAQYSPEQIDFLRKLPQSSKEKVKKKTAKELSENLTKDEAEEEGEYILWLA